MNQVYNKISTWKENSGKNDIFRARFTPANKFPDP